jgi:hypothetical protein
VEQGLGINNFPAPFKDMAAILFRCPTTGLQTQGWIAEELDERSDANEFVGVDCVACGAVHLVNPQTGELLGSRDKD